MNVYFKFAAMAAVIAVSACARQAPNAGQMVNDPYANGAYPGGVNSGVIGGPATPEFFKSSIGDTILFQLDQSTLTPDARTTLSNQAGWLNQNQGFSAVIEGHADEQGTREYNLALGARRANAVQEYLISQGVTPGRLRTVSYGKERPLEICSTEECFQKNRRAVTVVSPGAGM